MKKYNVTISSINGNIYNHTFVDSVDTIDSGSGLVRIRKGPELHLYPCENIESVSVIELEFEYEPL